jgi:RHS repeat-associated protein
MLREVGPIGWVSSWIRSIKNNLRFMTIPWMAISYLCFTVPAYAGSIAPNIPWQINTTNVTCVGGLLTGSSVEGIADQVMQQYKAYPHGCTGSTDSTSTYTRSEACRVEAGGFVGQVGSAYCNLTACSDFASGWHQCGNYQFSLGKFCPQRGVLIITLFNTSTQECECIGDTVWSQATQTCEIAPPTITLTGPSTTRVSTPGPAISQTASVTRNGVPEVGKAVSISLTSSSGAAISGTTDSNGNYAFTYVPPRSPVIAQLSATCSDCSNTATKAITVTGGNQSCPADPGSLEGNPINPALAYKVQAEPDYSDSAPHPLSLTRHYRSDLEIAPAGLVSGWSHNYAGRIRIANNTASVQLGNGSNVYFQRKDADKPWYNHPENTANPDRLEQVGDTITYTRDQDNSVWTFTNTSPGLPLLVARLTRIQQRNGWAMTLSYNAAGQLTQASNAFGRSLSLGYNASGQLAQVSTPDGKLINYAFNSSGNVQSASYPDASTRQYHYENPAFPQLLTGITNENGQRYATFSYDAQGRAIGTQHAGGVDSYQLSYPPDAGSALGSQGALLASGQTVDPAIFRSSAQVTDPLGNVRTVQYQGGDGNVRVLGQTSSAGGSQFATRDFGQGTTSPSTLPTTETDYLGFITTTSWDTPRRLPTAVTRAAGTPVAQTVQTQWHPTLRLPTLITETGRTTAFTYDSQGNVLSETVTDTSVTANTPNAVRTTAWTYTPAGLVATETAPNGAVTSYAYDSAGNPLTVRNALGHITTYAYLGADGAAGRVTSSTAPNGAVTSYSYDPRGRLLSSVQTAGTSTLATKYTYTLSGQLASASLPSGHAITYQYDAAQRLVGWQDNRGATGVYTLDAMGNRTSEQIKNPADQVVWQLARSINALNRVASETVGAAAGTVNNNQQTSYAYNANGSLVQETKGLATNPETTQYGLDGLRRVTQITNAANASANLAYNALDAVTTATDFKGIATATARDALGNALTTNSPDAGNQSAQYDALGLPKQITDALGQATSIARDALGRPTQITQADGRSTTLQYDLTGTAYNTSDAPNASKGFLSQITDTTDKTTYLRDGFGRITKKTQILAPFTAGTAKTVQYSYATSATGQGQGAGQLSAITYPNGSKISYTYSAAGQITQLNWGSTTSFGNPLVTNIQYTPLGQPSSWNWEFADTSATTVLPASRVYDSAGRLVQNELGSTTYDAAGRITSLTQQLYKPSNTSSTSTAVTSASATYSISYDSLGRISTFSRAQGATAGATVASAANTAPLAAQSAIFSYDANGNRLTSIQTSGQGANAQTTNRSYSVDPSSNKLLGFSQSQTIGTATGGASSSVNYSYDANGAMTGDGLRRYEFDAANRLANVTTGAGVDAPTTKYVHNALGQRLFKTEPQFAPVSSGSNPSDPGVMQALIDFFSGLWGGNTSTAAPTAGDKLGYAYYYDEDGSLLYEQGTGGANSTGSAHYVYLPTPQGPMPIATYTGSKHYAVHTDHLNTPRRLTQSNKQVAWQWAFSAFGDEQPTTAKNRFVDPATTPGAGSTTVADVTFNLRYPGQYFDKESNLHYNWMRSYRAQDGRYTQSDPIGLDGGWNKFAYAYQNPLSYIDSNGQLAFLAIPGLCAAGGCEAILLALGLGVQQASKPAAPPDKTQCCTEFQNVYEPNSGKHGSNSRPGSRGSISREPANGAAALANSVPVSDDVRIGYDALFDEIIIFRTHRTDEVKCIKYWHGYVVALSDLMPEQWRAGRTGGFPNWPRKPK